LNPHSVLILKQRIKQILKPDENSVDSGYRISSLYFDDQYNTFFNEKRKGILERDKFRVRFYNDNTDFLNLELKHKHGDCVSKDKAIISLDEFEAMKRCDYSFMADKLSNHAIGKFYGISKVRQLRPVAMVSYNREAYVYEVGNVRITFDSDLTTTSSLSSPCYSLLPDRNTILEVKYDRFIPLFISQLLTSFECTQKLAISKYCMARLKLEGVWH